MATKNIVPNADSEGGIGTSSKYWATGFIDAITTTGNLVIGGSIDLEGAIDVNGTTNLDIVDIDGAVNMATTALVTGVLTTTAATVFNGGFTSNAASTISTADNLDTLSLISTDADANAGPNLRFYRNSGSPADNDLMAKVDFEGRNDNSQDVVYASIENYALDVSDGTEDGELTFYTMVAGTSKNRLDFTNTQTIFNESGIDLDFRVESDNLTNAFFVQGSDGNVGIGTNTPASLLNIGDPGGNTTRSIQIEGNNSHSGMASTIGYFSNALYLSNNYYYSSAQVHPVSTYGQTAIICSSGTTTGSNVIDFSVSDHNESDNAPNVKFKIVDSGDVTVSTGNLVIGTSGKGIDFTAKTPSESGAGSVSSSVLNDYEEGTFTPVYSDDDGDAITNLVGQTGSYIKVGKLIYISGSLRTQSSSSTTGVSGNLNISGLPFTSDAVQGQVTFWTHETASAYNTPAQLPRASPVVIGGAVINIYKYSGSGGRTIRYLVSDLNMDGNSNFMFFSGTYEQA